MSAYKIPDDEYPTLTKSKKLFSIIPYTSLKNPRSLTHSREGDFTDMLNLLHTDNYYFTKYQEKRYNRGIELMEKHNLPPFRYFAIGYSNSKPGNLYTCVAFSNWSNSVRVMWYFKSTQTTYKNLLIVNDTSYDLSCTVDDLSPTLATQLKYMETTSSDTHTESAPRTESEPVSEEAFPTSSVTLDLS